MGSDIAEEFAPSITKVAESNNVSRMSLWKSPKKHYIYAYIMTQKIFLDKTVLPRVFKN